MGNDSPHMISRDGMRYWFNDLGDLHRVDGPAELHPDGSEMWYYGGLLHRLDGPAISHPSGYRVWSQNGYTHRLDGPAIIYDDQTRAWWRDDEIIPIVLCRIGGEKVLFIDDHNFMDFSNYPSYRYDEKLERTYMDDIDLALFMLSHVVVEMPYE